MDLRLSGKRALVAGASSGIGAEIAVWLAREGAAVVVAGRNRARADAVAQRIVSSGGQASVAIGDLAIDAGAEEVAEAACAAWGGVDILVNNAGGTSNERGASLWLEASSDDWLNTYSMNTVATVRLIRLLAPQMAERGWGRLIQVASSAANSPNPGVAHYAASKAAIVNLTVSVSKAFAGTGVTANTVSPGMIRTPALDAWLDEMARSKGWEGQRERTETWVLETIVPQTVPRVGMVEDIAAAVAYLASPLADFVNGANLRVDGGRSPSVN